MVGVIVAGAGVDSQDVFAHVNTSRVEGAVEPAVQSRNCVVWVKYRCQVYWVVMEPAAVVPHPTGVGNALPGAGVSYPALFALDGLARLFRSRLTTSLAP